MSKPFGLSLIVFLVSLTMTLTSTAAEIFRVVDEDGNVTFTDQPPGNGAEPMDLPELSVIGMQKQIDPNGPAVASAEEAEPTLKELRRMYRDFRITQPMDEQSFWGTANTVVVSWGSDTGLRDGMTAKLYVNGIPQDVSGSGSLSLQLDRGEHTVRAELFNGGRKPLVVSPTVTFFVKQAAVGFLDSPTLSIGY